MSPENFNHPNEEIDKLRKENMDLIQENQELRKQKEITVNKFETTIIEERPAVDEAMHQKMKDLEVQLVETKFALDQKTKEFHRELSIRDNANNELLQKISDLREREPLLLSSLESRTRERDSLLFKIEEMKKERDSLLFERENLLRSSQDLKVQLSEMRDAYGKVVVDFTQAKAQISTLEAEIQTLKATVAAKQEENLAVLLRLAEVESAKLEMDALRRAVEDAIRERDRVAQSMGAKDAEISKLKSELNKYAHDVQIKKDVIGHITQAEEVLVTDIKNLRLDLQKRDKIIEDFVVKQNEWNAQEQTYKEALTILKREKENVFTEVEELRIENQRLRVENDRLVPENANLQQLVTQKDTQISLISSDFSRLSQENRDLMNSVADLEKKRDNILLILGEREAEIRRLKDTLEDTTSNLQFFKEKSRLIELDVKKYSDLSKELEKENTTLKFQVKAIPELENRINALTLSNDQLKAQLEQFEKIKADNTRLQSEIDGLILNRDNLLVSIQEKEGELRRLRAMVPDYEALKKRVDTYEQEIQRLLTFQEMEEIRRKELEATVVDLQLKAKDEKELIDQNDRLLKENLSLRQKVQELEYNYATLNVKYQKITSIYSQIKGVAENIEDVHDKLIETCEETEKIDTKVISIC